MKRIIYAITMAIGLMTLSHYGHAQGVAINGDNSTPDASAMVDIKSTTKGMLIPRMTSAQRTSISGPAEGLLVYDVTTASFWFHNGSIWIELVSSTTTSLEDGDGDTKIQLDEGGVDDDHVRFDVDGTEAVVIDNLGRVGIGTATPSTLTEISSGTAGDAVLTITADTDNNNEADNPLIRFRQDGNVVTSFMGLEGNAGTRSTGTLANALMIGSEDANPNIQFITDDNVRMTIETGGDVGIGTNNPDESLSVDPDADESAEIGRAHIGWMTHNDWAGFSHIDANGAGTYALLQNSAGRTLINAAPGENITFRINNVDMMTMLSTGDFGIGEPAPTAKLHVAGSTRITGLGGAGTAMVVTDNLGNLSTQTIPANGDITAVTAGDGLTGGGTTGAVTLNVVATNGLTDNANDVVLGGALTQATTITQGNFGMTYNLTGTGDFVVQDNGTNHFLVQDNGLSFFGDDVYWRDGSTGGTNLMVFTDDGNDGRLRIYENGATSIDLDANSQFIFNEQGLDRDFRVESDAQANMFRVDAANNRIGIGDGAPQMTVEIGDAAGQSLILTRQDGTITTNEQLGGIGFDGSDGNTPDDVRESSASIIAFASENHGTGDKGGYLTFWTSPTNQNDDTDGFERMRIGQDGTVRVSDLAGGGTVMVVADNNGDLSTQAIPANGDITGVTAGDGLTGGGTTGALTLNVVATNGLTDNANDIVLGGALTQGTTITHGTNNLTHNLNNTGDFHIQDNGTNTFSVFDDGTTRFGDDVYWRDGNTGGTNLMILTDDGNDGRLRIYKDGSVQVDLDANSQFIFNELGEDRDFRIESDDDANMFRIDANNNRVGIKTGTPLYDLSFDGDADQTIGLDRSTAGDGHDLRIQAGGGQSGATNADGGNLYLAGGVHSGDGTASNVIIETAPRLGSSSSVDQNPTERMRISSTGNVLIGTTGSQVARLVVIGQNSGFGSSQSAINGYREYRHNGIYVDTDPVIWASPLSIYADGAISGYLFRAHSDERIKNIMGQSNSNEDLATLMKIKVTDYSFKDVVKEGNRQEKKVIAQQLLDVYPQAVNSQLTESLPDIYEGADIKHGWIYIEDHDLTEGEMIKIIKENNETEVVEVTKVIDGAIQVNSEKLTDEDTWVFVYGRQVDDFHTVDYDALGMLNVSATQELARRLKALEEENEALKAILNKNAALEERLKTLESMIGKSVGEK